jgi:membrane protein involved in colicin uptake
MLQIAPDGSVMDARAERGSPILVKAAIEAAQQWRYAPYSAIPGQAPLTTSVDFNFHLE